MALDQTPSVPSQGRSTWRVLGTLLLVVAIGLVGLAACVRAFVGSAPARTLEDDGTATALLARDPYSGCTVPWRAELRVAEVTGVFRDPCRGAAYDRDGAAIDGATPRGLDSYDLEVQGSRLIIDLAQVRLGTCVPMPNGGKDCSAPNAPVYRTRPPEPVLTPGS